MKRHPGDEARRGGVGGIGVDYFSGRQAMGQPGTFPSVMGGMLGSATYLHAVGYGEYMDDESHVGYAEVAIGAFPKTILYVAAVAYESGGCADTVPIEHQLVGGCTIVLFHVYAEVIEEVGRKIAKNRV